MSLYAVLRSVYRWGDRAVLQRLPRALDARLRAILLPLARRLFPAHITARSIGEFGGAAARRQERPAGLPAWARNEVASLVSLEPALDALVGPNASPEPYFIPWDMNYVGRRYAAARRQLHGTYACFVVLGGEPPATGTALLAAAPRPLAVIDVEGTAWAARLAQAQGADYVALPAEHLDPNDHCAVLARLVLQLAPRQVFHQRHAIIDLCIQRHGLALASVSSLVPWPQAEATGGAGPTAPQL